MVTVVRTPRPKLTIVKQTKKAPTIKRTTATPKLRTARSRAQAHPVWGGVPEPQRPNRTTRTI